MMNKFVVYVFALVLYTSMVTARESQLRVGKAVNIFLRYGYLNKSMRVISFNDTERWLFKEPTIDIYQHVNSVTETEEHNSDVFSGDFHMEFCDNRRQLYQAYFRDYTVEWLDKPWEAFIGGWDSDLAAKRLGINTSYIKGDYSYILVRVVRYREIGKSKLTDMGSQPLLVNVRSKVRSMKTGNVIEAMKFMERFGTHYINSYTTGNSIYQVYVYNKQNYSIIKERLKVKGVSGLSKLDLYNFFAPWYAEHLGTIRSASGNATVEEWASKKLTYEYYVIKYITILKLQGNGRLLNSLDHLLGNEAILQLDLKSLKEIFRSDEQKQWFTEVLDNQIKLWEVNMNQKNDPK